MGQIKDIIDKGYKEITDRLISRKENKDYFGDSTSPISDNLPHSVSGFDDCNDIFYRMLEDVGERAELEITHKSLFEFFGGHAFIDFGSIDTDGDIFASLLEVADYKRIASILYYAKHHKKYDEELERAYSEAIGELFEDVSEPDNCFVAAVMVKIDKETTEAIRNGAETAYTELYCNNELKKKYIMDKNDFMFQIGLSDYEHQYKKSTLKHKSNYEALFTNAIKRDQLLTIDECWNNSVISKTTRVRFFKCTFTTLAGFSYSELSSNGNPNISNKSKNAKKSGSFIGDHFILRTMQEDLCQILDKWYVQIKQKSRIISGNDRNTTKNDDNKNRTEYIIKTYIHSDEDMRLLHNTRNLFLQILIGNNNGMTEEDFLDYLV